MFQMLKKSHRICLFRALSGIFKYTSLRVDHIFLFKTVAKQMPTFTIVRQPNRTNDMGPQARDDKHASWFGVASLLL